MDMEFALLVWLLCAFITMWLFQQKNRSLAGGFLVGFLFAVVGVIIALIIPAKEEVTVYRTSSHSRKGDSWHWDSTENFNVNIRQRDKSVPIAADYKTCLNCLAKNPRLVRTCQSCGEPLRKG